MEVFVLSSKKANLCEQRETCDKESLVSGNVLEVAERVAAGEGLLILPAAGLPVPQQQAVLLLPVTERSYFSCIIS